MRMVSDSIYFGAAVSVRKGNLGLLRLKMKMATTNILKFLR
jgi:predicted regulator of Ras-like GTPase activity (Roadblock/LC7/MglB family)